MLGIPATSAPQAANIGTGSFREDAAGVAESIADVLVQVNPHPCPPHGPREPVRARSVRWIIREKLRRFTNPFISEAESIDQGIYAHELPEDLEQVREAMAKLG